MISALEARQLTEESIKGHRKIWLEGAYSSIKKAACKGENYITVVPCRDTTVKEELRSKRYKVKSRMEHGERESTTVWEISW